MKFCSKCGKEIMDDAVICPNCGCSATVNKEMAYSKKAKNAKIFGILSLLLLAPLGIPAIILANSSKEETGGVMNKDAKAGMTCGIIALVVWGIAIICML